ncbi:MAG: DUF3578 domain-containing protein [Acholeplasma sp.]|jgi:hypothetical protein|nr:DUF3578 domain-containing protein [Acholeplasma sp.]
MEFKDLFQRLEREKAKTDKKRVSSNPEYDNIILKDMPNLLRDFIQHNEIIVKPSVGLGNYADIPWICLLSKNTSISPNAKKGLYIVILFNKTGDSFYLALSQGITNFKSMGLSSKEARIKIVSTVNYFQNELPEDIISKHGFTTNPMDLGINLSTLAKGYIQTTIISKEFKATTFNQNDFDKSLTALLVEYDEIISHIGNKSYDDVINLISPIDTTQPLDKALESINNVLKDEYIENRDLSKSPIKVKKGIARNNRYRKITQPKIFSKTDYIKQAKEQHQTGLKGEQLALEIERKRIQELGVDPDKHIKWCSVESDSFGYDFESVDYFNGELKKIYVEVKASKDVKDTAFFLSKNELEVSKMKKKYYRVFRIYDITSITPKYYYADGMIEENFFIDPVTFSARYKYEVNI